MRSSLPSKPSTPPTTSKAVSNGWKRRRWNPPNSSKPSRSPARTSKVPTLPPFSLVRPFAPDLLRLLPHLLLRLSDPPSPSPSSSAGTASSSWPKPIPPCPPFSTPWGSCFVADPTPWFSRAVSPCYANSPNAPVEFIPPHQPSSRGSSRRRGRRVVFGPAFGAR